MEYQPPFPPPSEEQPVYGPFQPPRRRLPRMALAGGIAAGLALGGAGIAYASSSGGSSPATAAASDPTSTTPSTQPPGNGPAGQAPGHPGRFGMKGGGFGFPGLGGRVLYGQATIQQPDGTTKTVEFQSGTVSSVSGSSITLSTGNYSHTYKVDPTTVVDAQAGGINTVAKGDEVRLLATQQGGSDTAVNIVDVTKIKSSRSGFGFQGGKPPANPTSPTSTPATGVFWGGGPGGSDSGSQSDSAQVQ